jgi:hypothetical protein
MGGCIYRCRVESCGGGVIDRGKSSRSLIKAMRQQNPMLMRKFESLDRRPPSISTVHFFYADWPKSIARHKNRVNLGRDPRMNATLLPEIGLAAAGGSEPQSRI